MLADADAMATIAVKELETAKKFYKEKIGLPLVSVPFESGTRKHPAHSQRVKPMSRPERSPAVTRAGGRR